MVTSKLPAKAIATAPDFAYGALGNAVILAMANLG